MVLVDTSVWIDHFRHTDIYLKELLESGKVCIHPFIIGELACGNLSNRDEILILLRALPVIAPALEEEIFTLIEEKKLYGKGLGFIDVHLLASALIHRVSILSRDRSLNESAEDFGIRN